MNSQCLFVWFSSRATERPYEDRQENLSFEFLLYLFSDVGTPPLVRDELYYVKQPLLAVLGTVKVVKIHIPD